MKRKKVSRHPEAVAIIEEVEGRFASSFPRAMHAALYARTRAQNRFAVMDLCTYAIDLADHVSWEDAAYIRQKIGEAQRAHGLQGE